MAKKFTIDGSALIITDTISSDIEFEGPKKDYYFDYKKLSSESVVKMYDINNVNMSSSGVGVEFPIADCVDLNDVVFTDGTFRDFSRANLGFNTAPGSSGAIPVTQSNVSLTLGGVIDSTKEYFLDGIIDCTGVSIEIPAGGIYISGYNFDISGLISADNNFTLFTSPVGGSGNVLFMDFHIDITGTNSKVYDIVSDTGFEAIEVDRINYNNCTSLGTIDNYRQGLETGTGRFGGTPELTLKGVWVGGYFIDTSIVRSLTDGVYTLYKAGAGFLMSSRFRSNQNIDLPALASFLDFSTANFVNPSTLQLKGCIVTRNGVTDSNDANLTPNIDQTDLASDWDGNNGLRNTFVGGLKNITTAIETSLTVGVPITIILGTWTNSDLQHFDSNFNYSFRHLGTDPLDFRVTFDFVLKGTQDDQYKITLKKNSSAVITTEYTQIRTIDRLAGARDVTYFNGTFGVAMLQNDFLYWEVENITLASNNCTLELNSQWFIEER